MTYYDDLINDNKRVESFKKAIDRLSHGVVYDLGTGSGILAQFASNNAIKVFAIEQNPFILKHTKENFSENKNIKLIETDATQYVFTEKPDVIICEMLDTALIDEEQVPVLNYAKKFLKEDGQIIPGEIINTVELVNLQRDNVHWDEDGAKYEVLSDAEVYSKFNLLDDINPNFEKEISIKSKKDAFVNGLKITTFAKLNDNIICGPTPMLNPPLLIPLEKRFVKGNDFINVKLKYIMGNGIESIQTEYL